MSRQAGLLSQDLLTLQRFRSGFSLEFDILNDQGRIVGMVAGTEGGARRFFLGSRELSVSGTDGGRLARLSDVRDFWRDTCGIVWGDGSVLATVARKVAFFFRRFSIAPSTGEELMVKGSFLGRELNVISASGGGAVAQVSREWTGFVKMFLGHGRYALYYLSGTFPNRWLAILGSMTALDLM